MNIYDRIREVLSLFFALVGMGQEPVTLLILHPSIRNKHIAYFGIWPSPIIVHDSWETHREGAHANRQVVLLPCLAKV